MHSLAFIKLGGSVITDKRGQEAPDLTTIHRLAREVVDLRAAQPAQHILIGHGSGSFGHHYAAHYGIHRGLPTDAGADWSGYAITAGAVLRLNRIVVDALLSAGLPALALQPSASLLSHDRAIVQWETDTIARALERGMVPVIHGDVAFDTAHGCTIMSTETLFVHLTLHTALSPSRIILVGEDAVYTSDPRHDPSAVRIPAITAANIADVLNQASDSHGVDVTGGMRSKVETMWNLVQQRPGLEVVITGCEAGVLARALRGEPTQEGTRIYAG